MGTKRALLPILILTAATGACATSGGQADRDKWNTLTRADVDTSQQLTVYDVVRHERPNWLRVRGRNSITSRRPIIVYVDGMRNGGLEVLRTIPTTAVELIRFYGASEAHSRFGLGHTSGAIEVTTLIQ